MNSIMSLPLDSTLVLDLSSRMPGPMCTQILADLGAEVIKIENPKMPDLFRQFQPLVDGTGSLFHVCNRNKKGLTLELRHPKGRKIFLALAHRADVVVEAFRPGTMDRMGLGYETLKKANPALIYCSLTAFGQTGPYCLRPAHDLNLVALSGILDLLGYKDGPPIVPPVQISGLGGALLGAVGILSALLSRGKTGLGRAVDISLFDGVSAFAALEMSRFMAGHPLPRRGLTEGGGGYACFNVYRTADNRYLALGCLEPQFWEAFCRVIARESFIAEQWSAPPRQDELIEEVRSIFLTRTSAEWLTLLDPEKICIAPVNTFAEALQDRHVREQETWFRGELPSGEAVPQAAFPIRFDGERPGWRSHPPGHGEHTREILRELGIGDSEIEELRTLGIA
ncbi:MAG: CoA transferase [Syntrophaceae bacterium]|nr:CoA transferase [Syntrophaceae bacterium]